MKLALLAPLLLSASAASAQVFVTPDWLDQHQRDPGLVILQAAMDQDGYAAGHLPGSRYAPVMSFHAHGAGLPSADELVTTVRALGIDNSSRVVIVGEAMSAALIFVALEYLGHGALTSVVDGGVNAWKRSGRSLATGPSPTVAASQFIPKVRDDLVVGADWVAARLDAPAIKILDARSKEEYEGSTTQERLPRPGHIPGAAHLSWLETFVGEPNVDARLLPAEQLRKRFSDRGIAPTDTVVTYCTVGMRASHLYLAARALGLPARIYSGSMADWSPRNALPVVKGAATGGKTR